jgi:hypothetical protein
MIPPPSAQSSHLYGGWAVPDPVLPVESRPIELSLDVTSNTSRLLGDGNFPDLFRRSIGPNADPAVTSPPSDVAGAVLFGLTRALQTGAGAIVAESEVTAVIYSETIAALARNGQRELARKCPPVLLAPGAFSGMDALASSVPVDPVTGQRSNLGLVLLVHDRGVVEFENGHDRVATGIFATDWHVHPELYDAQGDWQPAAKAFASAVAASALVFNEGCLLDDHGEQTL